MTSIEWTDTVWNPVVGCSRVSAGCEHCYAERVAHRAMQPAHAGLTVSGTNGPRWTGEVRCLPERLDQPLHWRKPRRVFVNSMSDLFHEKVPDDFIDDVFARMALGLQHTYQVLTKRPDRMLAYMTGVSHLRMTRLFRNFSDYTEPVGPWPLPNVQLGVSVENQATSDERIPLLLQTPAALRFVSYEPAIGPVKFGQWLCGERQARGFDDGHRVNWLIVGGESGSGARPCDVEWIRSAVQQCRNASVPCFVKQLGARPMAVPPGKRAPFEPAGMKWRLLLRSSKGGDPAEWPDDLRVREFPMGKL